MPFEDEQIKEQEFSQNINDTENSGSNPIDNTPNNNTLPPPDVNGNGDVVKIQTQSIQIGSSDIYTPSSQEELDDLVSQELITEAHKKRFVLKYEAWYGELPKTKDVSKGTKTEPIKDQKIDLNTLFPELQNQPLPEENTQPNIDLNALRQEGNSTPIQDTKEKKEEGTGNVPKGLKDKIEKESGVSLDGVTVHYNSQEPFKYKANAFAKGDEVFLAPGQEELLSEELWHVVQQKQGLVKPTGTENGAPMNDAPDLERLAKKGQSETGGKEQSEEQREVIQKNDEKLTFIVPVKGAMTGKEFMILIEQQIYGQVINSPWRLNGVPIDPNQIMGEEGKTISYNVTVLAATYKHYRAQSETGGGVEVDESGGVKGADERSKELDALPKGTKDALIEEIDRRFKEASGKAKKEPGDEALWNVYRDEVLAQRAKILNLSEKAKKLIKKVEEGGIVIRPSDYPKVIKMIEKIEGLNDTLVTEYASRVTKEASSLEEMQNSLDHFIQKQTERGEHKTERTEIENELFASEDAFDDMKIGDALKIGETLSPVQAAILELAGFESSSDFYERATKKAQELGYKDLNEYRAKTQEYLDSFQQESVATGIALLQKYEHFLYEEEKRYLNSTDGKKLGDQVAQSGAKKNYEDSDRNASYAGMAGMAMGTTTRTNDAVEQNIQGYRDKSKEQKAAAETAMKAFGKDHPLLNDPAFDLKKLSKQSPEETNQFLLDYIKKQKDSIAQTIAKMQSDKDFVFTLDNLMGQMYQQESISKGSVQDKIIQSHISDIKLKDILISVGIALLAIGLGLLSGGTGTVGVMAAVGSVGLSIYDVTREFGKYTEENNAHDVGLLSKEPSFAWVMLSLVGAGLDFAVIAKLLKPLQKPVEKFTRLVGEDPVKALTELEKELIAVHGIDDVLRANLLKQARDESEFLSKFKAADIEKMDISTESKKLLELATYAIKNGYNRVEDFFDLLKINGLPKSTVNDLSPEEVMTLKNAMAKAGNLYDGFRSAADPVADVLGAGRLSHPERWNEIIEELKQANVEIVWRENGLAYSPTRRGDPGQMILDENASISALEHEFQHFLDNKQQGFVGMGSLFNSDYRIMTEANAYSVEIRRMYEANHIGVAEKLKNNFLKEVITVRERIGDPSLREINEFIDFMKGDIASNPHFMTELLEHLEKFKKLTFTF